MVSVPRFWYFGWNSTILHPGGTCGNTSVVEIVPFGGANGYCRVAPATVTVKVLSSNQSTAISGLCPVLHPTSTTAARSNRICFTLLISSCRTCKLWVSSGARIPTSLRFGFRSFLRKNLDVVSSAELAVQTGGDGPPSSFALQMLKRGAPSVAREIPDVWPMPIWNSGIRHKDCQPLRLQRWTSAVSGVAVDRHADRSKRHSRCHLHRTQSRYPAC